MQPSRDVRRLVEIMAALRDPVAGCPWDVEQTFASIAPFTIEEAYEVADAIERGDAEDLREELGDLLLQVVFHARMAEEAGMFDFGGVVEAITAKLIRRHPHVFGDARELNSSAVKALWGRIKADEKRAKLESRANPGLREKASLGALDGVPLALPALSRATKLQERAGKVGFDWNDVRAVLAKLGEEIAEVEAEIANGSAQTLSGEVGDLLFTAVNLARHLKVDPEAALRGANAKFERRFAHIESRLAEDGRTPESASLDEMESLWAEAKAIERASGMSGSG
ncbi:MAG TPA: nucleoside triphosphate pyrophosphohydrolase [Roseiarcus sp.]|nr:nucleoside triphosphate pyrophosphohydrolase [Roseiarcus sp.]